jgi:hypothetical protein
MSNLVIDRQTLAVVRALEAAGARVILLKGPSVARWLYRPGERAYVDIDLLLRPGDEKIAAGVLTELGYSSQAAPVLSLDRASYQEWTREAAAPIDLHPTLNLLEQLPADLVWEVLSSETEELALHDGIVSVLNEGARAMHVALHALSHGTRSVKATTDLERAVTTLPEKTWHEAVRVADRLGGRSFLAAALQTQPRATDLARRLALEPATNPALEVRRRGTAEQQAAALGVGWWLSLGRAERFQLLRQKMFPTREYLRGRSRLAQRGGLWLLVAYAARPFVILGWGLRGAAGWARARRVTR